MSDFISNFIENTKKAGYAEPQIYATEARVILFRLLTLQRQPFVILVKHNLQTPDFNYLLEKEDANYKNYRQREYLGKITIDKLCCITDHNVCIKDGNKYECYNLEGVLDVEDDAETSDIEVDEYPVTNIYPAFDLTYFIKNIKEFTYKVSECYKTITEAEEAQNEAEVKNIVKIFHEQGESVKARIFQLHKDAYNTRRDIEKYTVNLERIYKLRRKTGEGNDRLLFKIDRLAAETEGQIDTLTEKLQQERNQADSLLKNYYKYITRFSEI